MNFVFPAIVIFALALPGILFSQAYQRGYWKYPLGKLGPISEQVPKTLLYALILNAAWLISANLLHYALPSMVPSANRRAVVSWITNNFGKDQAEFDDAVKALTRYPMHVIGYFISLYVFSYGFGFFCHWVVRKNHWDWRIPFLRFDNDWHYLLKAEALSFADGEYANLLSNSDANISHEDRIGTVVTAVVDFKDSSQLFLGVLADYFFDSNGNLDRLLLAGVRRRDLKDDRPATEPTPSTPSYFHTRFYEVRAKYFILRLSEVKTLSIHYICKDDLEWASEAAEELEEQALLDSGEPDELPESSGGIEG